ncbi:MAG TPA: hypothetical protein VFE60_24675, partial [Roseiarcus sp.]|nr:hypothetical protein [Roseiarcus sp.]
DLILTNPPYVDAAAISRFPPEYAAEPMVAHAGGTDGLDIVRRILREAPRRLTAGGTLVCEVGGARQLLEHEFPHLPFVWLDTEDTSGEVFLARRRFRRGEAPGERQVIGAGPSVSAESRHKSAMPVDRSDSKR